MVDCGPNEGSRTVKHLACWLAPGTDTLCRSRSYHRPVWMVCFVLAVWLFAGLPPVYFALVAFITDALPATYLPF